MTSRDSLHWMVPGPAQPPLDLGEEYGAWLGSADVGAEEFARELAECHGLVAEELGAHAEGTTVALLSGEAMLGLWAALRNAITPGRSRVLCLATGLFGGGFAEMAEEIGAASVSCEPAEGWREARWDSAQWRDPSESARRLAERVAVERPDVVTLVHCETPCGTVLSNAAMEEIGGACDAVGAVLIVDFVSSAFAMEINVDKWRIDFGIAGSQKVLGMLPDLTILTISRKGWQAVDATRCVGYDSLLRWPRTLSAPLLFPYTPNWNAVRALLRVLNHHRSLGGPSELRSRHRIAAAHARSRLQQLGLQLYATCPESYSDTVTACIFPEPEEGGLNWAEVATALRLKHGVVIGGNYGVLSGKVFRIGHMGLQQASEAAVEQVIVALEDVLSSS